MSCYFAYLCGIARKHYTYLHCLLFPFRSHLSCPPLLAVVSRSTTLIWLNISSPTNNNFMCFSQYCIGRQQLVFLFTLGGFKKFSLYMFRRNIIWSGNVCPVFHCQRSCYRTLLPDKLLVVFIISSHMAFSFSPSDPIVPKEEFVLIFQQLKFNYEIVLRIGILYILLGKKKFFV